MAEEEAAAPTEGGEAAPEQPAEAPAEEAAPPPAEEAPAEAPAEAPPAEGGEAPPEGAPPAEGGEGGGEAAEGGGEEARAVGEGEGEAMEEQEMVEGEETVIGEEVARGEGDEGMEAGRPPSEAEEGTEEMEEMEREESAVEIKTSRIGIEGKPSVSVLEEQRRARLEKYGSRAKVALGSVIDIRYGSVMGDMGDRKVARFLNSYKLDSDNPFNPEKVVKILEAVITEALEDLPYDPDKCPKQAKWATSAIRARVKEMEFDRYKIVCIVTIGEKMGQDVLVTCRFLWDYDRDRYTTFSLENTHCYATAQCFGLYYE